MYVTNKLMNFLTISSKLSNSTILLTDLEKIVFVAAEDNTELYLYKKISTNLKNILSLYEQEHTAVNYINTTMESIVDLVVNDNISHYTSQIILPITHHDIEGLLIFFVNDREYIPSNLKFAKTTKHFTELFSSKDFF